MPERVKDLSAFLEEIIRLLYLINQCRDVLFRAGFRQSLGQSVEEAVGRLRTLAENPRIRNPEEYEEMHAAGLRGAQLNMKLESFEAALVVFDSEAGQDKLEDALDKGAAILGSLAGAIPGFGSFAQELVDFLLKELRRRFWRRK
jgi:hypothetical protein